MIAAPAMPRQGVRSRSLAIPLILLGLMTVTLAARLVPGPRTIDDAFITFRYSRNIVEGMGFVYNPGIQTLGTTTPLYTLLMAGLSAVTGSQDFPNIALVVNALCDAVTVALLYLLMRRFSGSDWLGILPALLWALAPYSVTFAIGGMETSLAVLLMVAATSIWTFEPGGKVRSKIVLGVLVALGLLTRIDSALWVGPLLLAQLWLAWRARASQPLLRWLPWRTWLAAALVLLPWLVFSIAYFGSPIPNSLSAKSVAYRIGDSDALVRLIQHYALPFLEADVLTPALLALGIGYWLCSWAAIVVAARREPQLVPFLIYPWLYFTAFAIANPLIFRWYLTPPLPALMFGIIGGLWWLSRKLRENRATRRTMPLVFAALGLVWMATTLANWTLRPDQGPDRPAPTMAWNQIELLYERMGRLLHDDYGVTSDTRVASGDIGAIGYFSRATIVDTVGLVTPELSRYYPVDAALIAEGQNYAIPPSLIYDEAPDYFVTMEAFIRLGLAQQKAFNEAYVELERFPTDFYGTGMLLYGRR